jgi:hypothetical protein
MDNLLSAIARDFPDYEATHVFEAAIPVYFFRLVVEVLEPQALSNFEIYFLHAVALDVNTREDIAALLGLDDRDLITPGASLLKRELIAQGVPTPTGKRPISLTERGREVLETQKVPPIPVRASAQMHFNALTWTPIPLEETWSVEQMDKDGLCVLPPSRQERPTLGDFILREVDLALQHVPFFRENRLIKLLELKKVKPEYIAPVTVAALCSQGGREQRFAIYRDGALQRGESAVLQRHSETGLFFLPDDAVPLANARLQIPTTLPPIVARVAQQLTDAEYAARQLQAELTDSKTLHGGTADRSERAKLAERIAQLEAELEANREESAQLKRQLQQNQGTFLRTEEHRAVLARALQEAREEVIVIAPWLNRRTCDDALCDLVAQAVKRGVRVRIGYGITERPGDPDLGRHHANAQKVIRALRAAVARDISAEQARLLDIQRVSDTHEKILVCDRSFAVIGSFNWLSYRGELDREYRREASVILRESASVAELARIALRGWP